MHASYNHTFLNKYLNYKTIKKNIHSNEDEQTL